MNGKKSFLIVEDSIYTRQVLRGIILMEFPDAEVTLAGTGAEGIFYALDRKYDLILLDLELPKMDGFSLLRVVMRKNPAPVLVVSKRDDHRSILKAMELGALDYIPKPTREVSPRIHEITDLLREKIRKYSGIQYPGTPLIFSPGVLKDEKPSSEPSKLLPMIHMPPRKVVGIGASTGGPATLSGFLKEIAIKPWVALILAQHLPSGFTRMFAEHLDQILPYPVQEAKHLDRLEGGRLYVLSGGVNTVLVRRREIRFFEMAPEEGKGYVPSIDLLFQSLADLFGRDAMGIVCTGMGEDGSRGAPFIREKGGILVAEDPETAVIRGMPQALIERAKPHYVVPLERMAGIVNAWIMGVLPPPDSQG
jgi:two-component system chemotaxis response regulator CheB